MKKELNIKTDAIKDFLIRRYDAKTIIIVGSRAVGDYKPNSDWDIYLFTNKKIMNETPNSFKKNLPKVLVNEQLDVYKYNLDIGSYPDKLWRDLRNSEVIFDSKSFGKRLKQRSDKLFRQGPKKWTKAYAQGRIDKANRYVNKFEDNLKDKNYEELFLRISWHYSENILDWWFGIRNKWPLRAQSKFKYIKRKDIEFYKQLKKITSDKTTYKQKINAFKKIHKRLFEDKKFKDLVK